MGVCLVSVKKKKGYTECKLYGVPVRSEGQCQGAHKPQTLDRLRLCVCVCVCIYVYSLNNDSAPMVKPHTSYNFVTSVYICLR